MFETCVEIRRHFSDFIDNACEPAVRSSLRYHLSYCAACQSELERAQLVSSDLGALPRRSVPAEADLRLRVRISQELHRNVLQRLWVRMDNALHALLLPASGGAVAALVLFTLMLRSLMLPVNHAPDVPLPISTPPQVRMLAPLDFNPGSQPLVVVTEVGPDGNAIGYHVISGAQTPEIMKHLDRLIYFSIFLPATRFGRPSKGRMVLSLREITVRG
ncbi:MAG: anti-sigma factor family protein [Terriglobia bacterium]